MDNNENNLNPLDSEIKPKRIGFFQRLRRGFTSVFQRRSHKKRSKSEPCVPEGKNCAAQSTTATADRLSVGDVERELPGDVQEVIDDKSTRDPNYRPPARAPIIVNDFTMELKKSLKLRSKMVEEGQTSEAIMQIEMTRSNYSATEEENLADIERKTVEEKVALFESQICGGSLQNSLSRTDKLGEVSVESVDESKETLEVFGENQGDFNHEKKQVGDEVVENLVRVEIDSGEGTDNTNTSVEKIETSDNMVQSDDAEEIRVTQDNVCLEISEVVNETGGPLDDSGDATDKEAFTNYEVTVDGENKMTITDEIHKAWEQENEKIVKFDVSSNESKQCTDREVRDLMGTLQINGGTALIEEKQSQMMGDDYFNNGILMTENDSEPIIHDVEVLNSK